MTRRTPVTPSRRDLLKGLALGGLAACAEVESSLPEVRGDWPTALFDGFPGTEDRTRFPRGVMCGEPTPDALVFWTRYDGNVALTLHRALFEAGSWRVLDPVAVVPAEGFVHADLADLPADTSVAYRFVDADGAATPIGHGRTALPAGAGGAVRILVSACFGQYGTPLPALSRCAAEGRVDVYISLGDTVYLDGARTLEQYRARWVEESDHDGHRDLFASGAGLFTWDDHEITNNWDPESIDPAQITNATRAFFDNLPLRRLPDAPDRVWRSHKLGDVAEVFVLDCRTERRRSQGLYLSQAQLDWLKAGLAASTATWKLVLTSVPITRIPGAMQAPNVIKDNWLGHGDGAQRVELLQFIVDEGLTGVLFLGGDIHMGALGYVDPDGPGASLLEVIAGPGGSMPNPIGQLMTLDEQIPYADAVNSMVSLDLSSSGSAWMRVIGAEKIWCEAAFDDRAHIGRLAFTRTTVGA
jgi:alkaline phosphatase D